MREDLLQQGIDLMIYGMGTVTFFLTLLVVATTVLSWVLRTFFPDTPVDALPLGSIPQATDSPVEPTIYRAIETAIKQHRARH